MINYACPNCGGSLEATDDVNIVVCKYCSTRHLAPKHTNTDVINVLSRANKKHSEGKFDEAYSLFNRVLEMDATVSEAYWGATLSKFGVTYVDDPRTDSKIPTCHKTQSGSILSDSDYLSALEYADPISKDFYEKSAHEINEIQTKILSIARTAEPYDVFICYKETAEDGSVTKDHDYAEKTYRALVDKGYSVFFAPVTLSCKLGVEYEAYIYSALQSSVVMIVIGTKQEYFEAPWVKNEWSRFLNYAKLDSKKVLIPCYADMPQYDIPEEFANRQTIDLKEYGSMQKILESIRPLIKRDSPTATNPTIIPVVQSNSSHEKSRAEDYVESGFVELRINASARAYELFEKALILSPSLARAYVGILLINYGMKSEDCLRGATSDVFEDQLFIRACEYADEGYRSLLLSYKSMAENEALERQYKKASEYQNDRKFQEASELFTSLGDYKDSKERAKKCSETWDNLMPKLTYTSATNHMKKGHYSAAMREFGLIRDYQDSEKLEVAAQLSLERCVEESRAEALPKTAIKSGIILFIPLWIVSFFVTAIVCSPLILMIPDAGTVIVALLSIVLTLVLIYFFARWWVRQSTPRECKECGYFSVNGKAFECPECGNRNWDRVTLPVEKK